MRSNALFPNRLCSCVIMMHGSEGMSYLPELYTRSAFIHHGEKGNNGDYITMMDTLNVNLLFTVGPEEGYIQISVNLAYN